jgi:putative RNA ligase
VKLEQLLDIDKLYKLQEDGLVHSNEHPTLPLVIFNYTPKAAFENVWGDGVIDHCRGLIVSVEKGPRYHDIVARPFKKFHNLNTTSIPETMLENLPPYLPEITKKMDGSLGIWYPDGTEFGAIATRGSFTSPQALWATKWWKDGLSAQTFRQHKFLAYWDDLWTPLFEIIYPDNRIVVDYGSTETLVCIGGVYLETGLDVPRHELQGAFGDYVVEKVYISHKDLLGSLEKYNAPNEEGYVASYDQGRVRVKIKFEDYKRLHRIITGVNPRSLWELLRDGKMDELITKDLPQNFLNWADKWTAYLIGEYNRILEESTTMYANRPFREAGETERYYRAKYARFVINETATKPYLKPIMFSMFDGHDGGSVIWGQLEPAGNDGRFSTSGVDATVDF